MTKNCSKSFEGLAQAQNELIHAQLSQEEVMHERTKAS